MPEYEGAEHDEHGAEHDEHEDQHEDQHGARHEAAYEAGYEDIGALLAAITDEPLPEGARDDTRFMAEHRSAVADVALLREQLRLMGDTLAGGGTAPGPRAPEATSRPARAPAPLRPPKPKPSGPRRPGRYRRYAGAAVGALVIAAGTALLGGLAWLGAHGGADDSGSDAASSKQEGSADLASPGAVHLACSRILVEGTVRSITPAGAGNVRVVLEVKRHYRPAQAVKDHPTATVTLPESAREDLKAGTYALVRVPVYAQDRVDWETGPGVADARGGILEALPGARGLRCPGPDEGRG